MNRPIGLVIPAPLAAMLGLAACGAPPQPAAGTILGFGTPGVSSYVPAVEADNLQAQLDRCRPVAASSAPPRPQTLEAACDQLRRTFRNQPGNTVPATR